MFRCQFCKKVTKSGTPCHLTVVRERKIFHPMRPKVHKRYIIEEGKRKKVFFDDKGGWGFQTDIELKACPECHEKYEKEKKSFTDV